MNKIQQLIQDFFSQASEVNYNFIELYHKAPTSTITFFAIIAVIIATPILIYLLLKKSRANKVINKIIKSQNIDQFDSAYIELLDKLEQKENKYILKHIYKQKDLIENRYFEFVNSVNIKDKIIYIQSLASKYNDLAQKDDSSKALVKNYFEQRAQTLISEDLLNYIQQTIANLRFWDDEFDDIYAVVEYANTLENPDIILDQLKDKISHLNFGNDILAVKFVLNLDKNRSEGIYDFCINKLQNRFNQDEVISSLIIDSVYDSDHKEFIYKYVSNISDKVYIEFLYNKYFSQKDDFNLDLAFIENDLISNEDHHEYLMCATTDKWKDIDALENICKNKHTVNILGHEETRKIISRTDELNYLTKQSNAEKKATDALAIAQEALEKLKKLEESNLIQE